MAISRIQLRGISRSPSDRMTEDGGVAESLNVFLDDQEQAPAIFPEDVTQERGLPINGNYDVLYIHKTANYENYIISQISGDKKIVGRWEADKGEMITILELEATTEVSSVAHVGNTLIFSTSEGMRYVLRKDGGYKTLGEAAYFPHINFFPALAEGESYRNYDYQDEDDSVQPDSAVTIAEMLGVEAPPNLSDEEYDAIELATKNAWKQDCQADGGHKNAKLKEAVASIWEIVDEINLNNKYKGAFIDQIFVRYAIKLYDGSILSSMPILMNAGQEAPYTADVTIRRKWRKVEYDDTYDEDLTYNSEVEMATTVRVNNRYTVRAKILDASNIDLEDWADVIESINIYISPNINTAIEKNRSELAKYNIIKNIYENDTNEDNDKEWWEHTTSESLTINIKNLEDDGYEKALLEASNFYLIKEIKVKDERGGMNADVMKLFSDYGIIIRNEIEGVVEVEDYVTETPEEPVVNPVIEEVLLTQPRLTKDDMKHYVKSAEKLSVYNNSLFLCGIRQECVYDYNAFNAAGGHTEMSSPRPTFSVTYILRGEKNDIYVKAPIISRLPAILGSDTQEQRYYSLLFFPDPRCYKAVVDYQVGADVARAELEMKAHPYLDCAYFYGGVDTLLSSYCNMAATTPYTGTALDEVDNKLYASNINNPFLFPNERILSFDYKVQEIAVATMALSSGQFGQFPLYVFTDGGIYAVEIGADGSFMSQKLLSRDVSVNRNSIRSIDQAVVFTSSKGVMLLQGSQTTELSPYMNGKHYAIEPMAKLLVDAQELYSDLADTLTDTTPFMAFAKDATIAYDYEGKRLILINPNEKYQYIYKIDTQSWHKIQHSQYDIIRPLNSFPVCEAVATNAEGYTSIIDLSTHLDTSKEQIAERGVIATRPFDLGEPDTYKTIKDVRIRGQFPKGAVKFILLGSNDGINFYTISTLRGKSWKLFRIVMLANLSSTDRISWIDVQYETRFTNKLR